MYEEGLAACGQQLISRPLVQSNLLMLCIVLTVLRAQHDVVLPARRTSRSLYAGICAAQHAARKCICMLTSYSLRWHSSIAAR